MHSSDTKTAKTNYVEAFQRADEMAPGCFELMGDVMLVREVQPPEVKSKGGLILTGGNDRKVDGFEANRPCWVEVLKVGEGYFDADGDTIACDTKAGDVVLVGKLSVKWLSHFGPLFSTPEFNLGIIRESEVQARFAGSEKESTYFTALQAALAA